MRKEFLIWKKLMAAQIREHQNGARECQAQAKAHAQLAKVLKKSLASAEIDERRRKK